jgi:hypothetical protein
VASKDWNAKKSIKFTPWSINNSKEQCHRVVVNLNSSSHRQLEVLSWDAEAYRISSSSNGTTTTTTVITINELPWEREDLHHRSINGHQWADEDSS